MATDANIHRTNYDDFMALAKRDGRVDEHEMEFGRQLWRTYVAVQVGVGYLTRGKPSQRMAQESMDLPPAA